MFIKKFTAVYIVASFCLGCQTPGIYIEETPLNISETRKVITTIIGQPRLISENGRELYSKYYDKSGRFSENIEKAKERIFTKIIILGDRRPYSIKVEVLTEAKNQEDHYEVVIIDDIAAEKTAGRLKAALYQSHNSRNVIDDFRPL